MPTGEPTVHLALIALALGLRDRYAGLYARLEVFRGQYHDALVDRVLGELALGLGNWAAARRVLADAETVARKYDCRPELAITLRLQAALVPLILASGVNDAPTQTVARVPSQVPSQASAQAAASAKLQEAVALFQSLEMVSEATRTDEALALTRAHASSQGLAKGSAKSHLPAGLSTREGEVLGLVATGLTNREIAQRLFLSEKTVANHITNIFNKLGVDNRAGATAFAVRHGIAAGATADGAEK